MRFLSVYDTSPEMREKTTIYFDHILRPSMTKQEYKQEVDINNIIKRYNTTGLYTDPMLSPTKTPLFGDFADVPDLMEAQNQLIEAEEAFMTLPSELRRRFDNDPLALLEFLQNGENRDEAMDLGLIPRPVETPLNPVVEPPAAT